MKKALIVILVLSSLPATSDTQPGLSTSSTMPGTGLETVRDHCGDPSGTCARSAR